MVRWCLWCFIFLPQENVFSCGACGTWSEHSAAPCFTFLPALALIHCPRNPRDLQLIRGKVWTNRCMYILVLQFMLILTDFDQKLFCQQACLVSFHEENIITNHSMKTLHFKGLFYKCITEFFPSQASLQEHESWWIMQIFAPALHAVPFLGGRAGDLTELCQPQQMCFC